MTPEEIARVEATLEPEGWEPPEFLTMQDVLRLAAIDGPVANVLPSLDDEQFFDEVADKILSGATRKPREVPAPRPEPRQEPLKDPTLAQVWEQGHEAGLNDMSTCCGCSTPMEETPNPYE